MMCRLSRSKFCIQFSKVSAAGFLQCVCHVKIMRILKHEKFLTYFNVQGTETN
jgi:hypothetical protein